MSDSPSINEGDVVKVLMQEYLSARKEVILHVQLYKNTFGKNGAILFTVVGILLPLLSGQDITLPVTNIVFHSTRWTDLAILFTISTIAFLLIFLTLAILFTLQVLAERCVHLEDEINKFMRGPYLFWEHFAHQIWSKNSKLVSKMAETGASVFFYLLVLFFAFFLPLFVLTKSLCGDRDPLFTCVAAAFISYLFAVPGIAIYVNSYTMGDLRDDCRKLLQASIAGRTPPSIGTGLTTVLAIAGTAIAGALMFVNILVIPQSSTCALVGKRSLNEATMKCVMENGSCAVKPGAPSK